MARVGIVILNWNGWEVLKDCLHSVFALHYSSFEVVVVDNGSRDGSAQMVRSEFPKCLLIQNQENLGFSVASNQGIRLALDRGNDYVMVLNNDTLMDPGCLTFLVERAESGPEIGAVTPKIYFADQPDRLWFAGGTFSYWKGRNGLLGYKQKNAECWNIPGEKEFISGCALLASRNTWEKVGGFDELLFVYGEDVDWSLRARKAGFKLFYEPRAVIWHCESFTVLRNEWHANKMYYYTRNSLVVMWKHGRWWHWITFLPYQFALSVKCTLRAMARGDWNAVVRIAEGFRDFPATAWRLKCQPATTNTPLVDTNLARSDESVNTFSQAINQ